VGIGKCSDVIGQKLTSKDMDFTVTTSIRSASSTGGSFRSGSEGTDRVTSGKDRGRADRNRGRAGMERVTPGHGCVQACEELSKSKGPLEAWGQLNMSAADAEAVAKIVADAEAVAKFAANAEGVATAQYGPARQATEGATAAMREASGKVAANEMAARAAKARAEQAKQAAQAAAQGVGEQPSSGMEGTLRRILGQDRTWEHGGATGAAGAA
jgi:membrane protein involved in colicin uptake